MPTQAQSLKCIIVNDTDFDLVATMDPLNFKLEQGTLDGGLTSPPCPIRPHARAEFTTSTPAGSTSGPDGWICYEFVSINVVAQVVWRDTSAGSEGFHVLENRLDGARREIDPVAVTFTSDGTQAITFDQIKDAASFVATYTLRLKPDARASTVPVQSTVDGGSVAGPPAGNAAIVIPTNIRKWDDPRMSQKRKKLLAYIGNLYPMLYWPEDSPVSADADASHGGGHYKRMLCWQPKDGGTSCTGCNSAIGKMLSGNGALWAFHAPEWKDAWVAWGTSAKNKMPSVGDIYILYRDKVEKEPPVAKTDSPHERHCGFVLQVPKAPGENWITGDGGQQALADKRQAAFLNSRPWEMRIPGEDTGNKPVWVKTTTQQGFPVPIPGIEYPYLGGGAESKSGNLADANRLLGWIDLDLVPMTDAQIKFDPDAAKVRALGKYTQADYEDLGRRINSIA